MGAGSGGGGRRGPSDADARGALGGLTSGPFLSRWASGPRAGRERGSTRALAGGRPARPTPEPAAAGPTTGGSLAPGRLLAVGPKAAQRSGRGLDLGVGGQRLEGGERRERRGQKPGLHPHLLSAKLLLFASKASMNPANPPRLPSPRPPPPSPSGFQGDKNILPPRSVRNQGNSRWEGEARCWGGGSKKGRERISG